MTFVLISCWVGHYLNIYIFFIFYKLNKAIKILGCNDVQFSDFNIKILKDNNQDKDENLFGTTNNSSYKSCT